MTTFVPAGANEAALSFGAPLAAPTSAIELVPRPKELPAVPSSPTTAEIPLYTLYSASSPDPLTLAPSSASTATTLAEAPEPPALTPASSPSSSSSLAPSSSPAADGAMVLAAAPTSSSTDKLPTPPIEKPAPATGSSGLTSTQIAGGAMVASALAIGVLAVVAARRRRRRRNPRRGSLVVPVIVATGVGLTTVLFLSMVVGEKNP